MLTTHVVSQGLAAELKANGWPQGGSAFYWVNFQNTRATPLKVAWRLVSAEEAQPYTVAPTEELGRKLEEMMGGADWIEIVAAPLASELMERLPDFVNLSRSHRGCHASILDRDLEPIEEIADTLPDALAKLALHLMKEGKWKP